MQFTQQILLIFSLMVLTFMMIYTYLNRKDLGARPFLVQTAVTVLWTLASLMEFNSYELERKVFWRNVQQIGIFIGPISNLFFAIEYTKQLRLRKYAVAVMFVPLAALFLIFTDPLHHFMRVGVTIGENEIFGRALIVESTTLGRMFVVFNFCLPIFTVLILVDFMRRVTSFYRRRVFWIVIGLLWLLFSSWLRVAVLQKNGYYIPGAVLFTPTALILFLSIYRYKFFSLSPVARDKVFDVLQEAIIVTDASMQVIDRNEAALLLLSEQGKEELLGVSLHDVFTEQPELLSLVKRGEEQQLEFTYGRNSSTYLFVRMYPLVDSRSEQIGTVIMLNDITAKKQYELYLKERAYRDGLTGLYNRAGLQRSFEDFLLLKGAMTASIIMLDIDFFKKINDTFGHLNGDRVIQHLARILETEFRNEAIIGRFGGEEFAVILPNVTKDQAYPLAETVRKFIEREQVLSQEGKQICYTISIGITDSFLVGKGSIDLDHLLHEADVALYQAKKHARNCTVVYAEETIVAKR